MPPDTSPSLAEPNEFRDVFRMAAPLVITTCSPMVMRIADFVFVSALGDFAQAAILPAQMVLWCYIALCFGTLSVVNTLAAQSLGRQRPRDCGAYAWQAVYLAVGMGLVGLCLRPLVPGIFRWIDHPPEVRNLEIAYVQLSVVAILPTIAAHALSGFFNGVHRPRFTMQAALEANAVNIALNYAFIFGKLGAPEMGFTGAAMGTIIASIYHVTRLLVAFLGPWARSQFHTAAAWRVSPTRMLDILRIGWPAGIRWLSDVTVWMFFISFLVGRFGHLELDASNVAWQYIRIAFMPMIGVGEATTALVGRSLGEGNVERSRRITRFAVRIALMYVGTLAVVYVVFPAALIRIFNSNPEVVALGSRIMICVALFLIFDVIGTIHYDALRGAGDTTWPMFVMVAGHWLVVVGGGSAMVAWRPDLRSLGPWIMATLLISIIGVVLVARWRSNAWTAIRLFRDRDLCDGTP